MPLSPAERQRAFRQRQKVKATETPCPFHDPAEDQILALLDQAAKLATEVNARKEARIKARLAEIDQEPSIKPHLPEIVRLHGMLDQLASSIRWSLPTFKIRES